jgi:hypothetical protein
MLVKLTEVCSNGTLTTRRDYSLREVFVNPEHVVMIREEARLRKLNEEGVIDPELKPEHRFTKLTINRGHTGTEIVVVGAPSLIEDQLSNGKKLLRG